MDIGTVRLVKIEEEMRGAYLDYAMSVITSRALPDVRDGLKPVQRRILYTMDELSLRHTQPYKKSARIVGECFVAGTRVLTERGLVPIEQVERGDRVFTQSGLAPVTELFEMPERELLRITLENGLTATMTPSQPVKVLTPHLTWEWKEARDLGPDDHVVLRASYPDQLPYVRMPDWRGSPVFLDENVAYVLGLFLSDGWFEKDNHRFCFFSTSPAIIHRVAAALEATFGYRAHVESISRRVQLADGGERESQACQIRVSSGELNAYLATTFGISAASRAATKRVPELFFQSPKSVIAALLTGMFDGDGSVHAGRNVVQYGTVSPALADDLQLLLLHLGVVTQRFRGSPAQSLPHYVDGRLVYSRSPYIAVEAVGRHAQVLGGLLDPAHETKRERLSRITNGPREVAKDDQIPHAGLVVFDELSRQHVGSGWYRGTDGQKFRAGIRYPGGSKIRYAVDLREKHLGRTQVSDWGIGTKLERIGSSLAPFFQDLLGNDVYFLGVARVEPAPAEKTYDLQVAGPHEFVANGIVSHNCMGKYHPHGDAPVYETMVRMAQEFSMRYPLVDGQGNFGCFAGSTRVRLADGSSKSFEELVEDDAQGKTHFTYTVGTAGEVQMAPIRAPRLTRKNAPVVRVILDKSETIVCTPDHRFMLRDGSYCEAKNLQLNASLMPFYSRPDAGDDLNLRDYEEIYQPVTNEWQFAHHLADAYNLGTGVYARGAGKVRHHRDFNKLNNDPPNIVRMQWADHRRLHLGLLDQLWEDANFRQRMSTMLNGRRATQSRFLAMAKRAIICDGDLTAAGYDRERRATGINTIIRFEKGLARFYGGDVGAAKAAALAHQDRLNHRVVSVEAAGFADVYDLTVDNSHNFALAAGVFVHNSVDGDAAAAMRYTEARLAAIAEELLVDIDKNTVDFVPNFDESLKQPSVLPAKVPNLLVNGSSGIAVGMATNIPPHNLTEVADAAIYIIDHYDACISKGVPFDLVWARAMNLTVDDATMAKAYEGLPRPFQAQIRAEAAKASKTRTPTTAEFSHALLEYVNATIDILPDKLMELVRGPDFPTGGIIHGLDGIKQAYTTGHGRIVIDSKVEIEEVRGGRFHLIVRELPFQVNKASLIERIAELVRERKIPGIDGISDLRDESDRDGMRIVVELKRDARPQQIINILNKHTAMRTAFSVNLLALVDGQPRVLTLKMALLHYLNYRKTVLTRRTQFELDKARAREHILQGLKIALDHLDAVIQTIRQAKDSPTARTELMGKFKLTEAQAEAILDMQLRRLAALERQKILQELKDVLALIKKLEDLLANPLKILKLVRGDLIELKTKYGDARRTQIHAKEAADLTLEDLIPDQEVAIIVTRRDYVKRLPSDTYRVRGRGGKGSLGTVSREDDGVQHLLVASTHDDILFFTNRGRVFQAKAHELPDQGRSARGMPLINFIKVAPDETVTAMVRVSDFARGGYFVFVTRKGEVKRVKLDEFAAVRSAGLIAMLLEGDDELVRARRSNGDQDVVLVSKNGQAMRFGEDEIRASSRASGGVRGMRLDKGDAVIAAEMVEPGAELLIVSERGFAKRTDLAEFPSHGRGGGGVKAMSVSAKAGKIATARIVRPIDEVMVISAEGQVLRTSVEGISKQGRAAQGVILMNLAASDRVAAVAILDGAIDRGNGDGNGHASGAALQATAKPKLAKPRTDGKTR